MCLPVAELQRVSSPRVLRGAEIGKEVHVVRKLTDLNGLIPHSSLGHLVFKQLVALELHSMVLGKSEQTVLARVDSANNHRIGSLVLTLTQLRPLLVVCVGMVGHSSSRRDQNKGGSRAVVSAPAGAIDPVV